jgi:hypothetical protein
MAIYKGIGYDATNAKNRTGTSSDTVNFATNMAIDGNLDVTGNIISRDEERVLVQDNFLDINFGYVTVAGLAGGVAVNYLPVAGGVTINTTSNAITFTAAAGEAEPRVSLATTSGLPADTFAAGDIVQIAGTTNAENDGFYVVEAQGSAGILDIESTATTTPDTINFKPAQVNFTAEVESSSTSVTIFKVNVNVLQTSTAGAWQVQNGATDSSFATFTPLGTSTLQQAYDAGNTITTDGSGAITITLSTDAQGFSVQGNGAGDGDVTIGGATAVSSIVMAAQGAASSWTSTGQNLSIATATSGELDLTSAGALDLNGVAVTVDGSGGVSIGGSGAACDFTATAQALSIETVTSGALDVTSAGTLACTGAGVSTFGDDTAVWSFDGLGAVTETGMTSIAVTPSAAITLTGGAASSYTTSAGALTITSAAAATWSTGAGALTLTSAAAATWSTSAGALTVNGTGGVNIQEGGGDVITISDSKAVAVVNATTVDIDGSGAITMNSSGSTISIGSDDIDQAINIGTDGTRTITIGEAADSTISIKSLGGTLTLDGTGQTVDLNSAALDIDASGAITVDASANNSITVAAGTASTATGQAQIISSFPQLVKRIAATGGGLTAGDVVYLDWDGIGNVLEAGKGDADAIATSRFGGVALESKGAGVDTLIAIAGVVKVVTSDTSITAATHVGQPVYVSLTAGKITPTAPTASGDVIYQVGICVGGATTAWEVLLQPQFIMEIG